VDGIGASNELTSRQGAGALTPNYAATVDDIDSPKRRFRDIEQPVEIARACYITGCGHYFATRIHLT
jgi:hypothetical protein